MITDLEKALNDKRAPWTEIEYRTKDFWVFRDAYPVAQGHLLFVPTQEQSHNLWECYKAAYKFGYDGVEAERWMLLTSDKIVEKMAAGLSPSSSPLPKRPAAP